MKLGFPDTKISGFGAGVFLFFGGMKQEQAVGSVGDSTGASARFTDPEWGLSY